MDIQSITPLPIAQLRPSINSDEHYIRGIVTLVWPYTSSTHSTSILLVEPDFRLRRKHGQVRITFRGASAKAIAKSGLLSGDELVVKLSGAQYVRDPTVTNTPGKGIEWELQFGRRLVLQFKKATEEPSLLDIDPSSPSPPRGPSALSPPQSPVFHVVDDDSSWRSLASKQDPSWWSSPAFLKRNTGQNIPILSSRYNPIAVDDGFEEPAPKRTKFGRGSGQWRFSERTPSPEKHGEGKSSGQFKQPMHLPLGIDIPEHIPNPGDQEEGDSPVRSEEIARTAIETPIIGSVPEPEEDELPNEILTDLPLVPPATKELAIDSQSNKESVQPSTDTPQEGIQEKWRSPTRLEETAQTPLETPTIGKMPELEEEELSSEIPTDSLLISPGIKGLATDSQLDKEPVQLSAETPQEGIQEKGRSYVRLEEEELLTEIPTDAPFVSPSTKEPATDLQLTKEPVESSTETPQEGSLSRSVDEVLLNEKQTDLMPATGEAATRSQPNNQPLEIDTSTRAFTPVSDTSEGIGEANRPEQPRLRPILSAGLPIVSPLLERKSERSFFFPQKVLIEERASEYSTNMDRISEDDHELEESVGVVNRCTEVEYPVLPKEVNEPSKNMAETLGPHEGSTLPHDDLPVNVARAPDRVSSSHPGETWEVNEQRSSGEQAQFPTATQDGRGGNQMEIDLLGLLAGSGGENEELHNNNSNTQHLKDEDPESKDSEIEFCSQIEDTFQEGQVDPYRLMEVDSIHSEDTESIDIIDSQRLELPGVAAIEQEHLVHSPQRSEEGWQVLDISNSNQPSTFHRNQILDVNSNAGVDREAVMPGELVVQENWYLEFTPEASGVSRIDFEIPPGEVEVDSQRHVIDSFAGSQDPLVEELEPYLRNSSESKNLGYQVQLPTPLATQSFEQMEVDDDAQSLDKNKDTVESDNYSHPLTKAFVNRYGYDQEDRSDSESHPSVKALVNRYDYDQEDRSDSGSHPSVKALVNRYDYDQEDRSDSESHPSVKALVNRYDYDQEDRSDSESHPSVKALVNRYDYDQEDRSDADVRSLKSPSLSDEGDAGIQDLTRSLLNTMERDPGDLEPNDESHPSIEAIVNSFDYGREDRSNDEARPLKRSRLSEEEDDESQHSRQSLLGADERGPGDLERGQQVKIIPGLRSGTRVPSSKQSSSLATSTQLSILTNGFRTPHSYFTPLSALRQHFNATIDTFAVAVSGTPIARAKKGPRDFYETLYITDPSITASESEAHFCLTQIFRPYKIALPLVQTGDILLLREFKVQTQEHNPVLLSTNSSSWVVYSEDDGEQIRGPPVEFGDQERNHAKGLRDWWQSLEEGYQSQLIESIPPSKPPSKAKGKGTARKSTGGRLSDTVHQLRDGTKYLDNRPDGMDGLHELRDGTIYTNDVD